MSILVFCSFEVGGQPFRYAEVLNKHETPAFYVSLADSGGGHDSTQFHFGDRRYSWDVSRECCSGSKADVISGLRRLKREYGIDACLATGHLSYLLHEAGLRYKYWSYGSDLDQMCYFPRLPTGVGLLQPRAWMDFIYLAKERQKARKTICRADAVMAAPYQEGALSEVCSGSARFFLPHLIGTHPFEQVWQNKTADRQWLSQQYGAENLFFSSVRHHWEGSRANDTDNKGNDKILETFARYLELSGRRRDKLVLVAKGPDVAASQAIARRLGLTDYLVWQEEMPREQLARLYSGATLCLGQFGTPVLTYAALEPLAVGTPCVSYYAVGTPAPSGFYRQLPPIWNSNDPHEIAELMSRVAEAHEEEYKNLCASSWQWIHDHCSETAFVQRLKEEFCHEGQQPSRISVAKEVACRAENNSIRRV